ncbi:death domain-containing ATP nucleosidase-like isoform X1 [Acropora muricata]|uniref:death domain-containing ATP nucleosidase-like isoform X1 n=1 Tax=Acropora muricata TaxID=159855 RepID=UPI0034E3A787
MAMRESRKSNTDEQRSKKGPPELQFTVKKLSDLKVPSKRWEEVELPIDILLLTVDKYGFLCCFHYLREVFRSFKLALGHVYFGEMGESDSEKLQVALMQCCEGGGQPGGAGIMVPKAVEMLRPKAVFCVGSCAALHHDKTRLGDVVVAAKLTTYAQRRVTANKVVPCGFSIPASKRIWQLIPCAAFGWKPPLKNPAVEHDEVKVHSNGEILSGPEEIASVSRRNELVQLYPNAIAVEMDGDGVFAASHDLKAEWIVIKGISRYADCNDGSDDWLVFANAMAASVVNNILSEPYVFEEWPHCDNEIKRNTSKEPAAVLQTNAGVSSVVGALVQAMVGKYETSKIKYKGRVISCTSRYRYHSLAEPFMYIVKAKDKETGIEEESCRHDTRQEATEHALRKLKERLHNEGIVNLNSE